MAKIDELLPINCNQLIDFYLKLIDFEKVLIAINGCYFTSQTLLINAYSTHFDTWHLFKFS